MRRLQGPDGRPCAAAPSANRPHHPHTPSSVLGYNETVWETEAPRIESVDDDEGDGAPRADTAETHILPTTFLFSNSETGPR
jgi:hypothetical protein